MSKETAPPAPPATLEAALERITELQASLAEANSEAGKRRKALAAEREAHNVTEKALERATGELGQFKAKADAPPDEWKTKHDELLAKLHARDAKDEWSKAIGDTLHEKVPIEKLWAEIGYTPGEALPTPEEIAEQVKTARENAPYLFNGKTVETTTPAPGGATKTTTKPPLKETVAAGRGAPDTTASRVTVRRSQLGDPKWALDPHNKKMLADASKSGVLDVSDD